MSAPAAGRRVPSSTYRLQVTADFDLFEAARRLPYLHELGVDWVYLSPILAAEPGSTHGYDVVAFDHVDGSRGGAAGLSALSQAARALGMGVLVDIVPNHVGVATPAENAWWWDLLTHGRGSSYAAAFDVDWAYGGDRLRLPVLGDDDLPADGGPIGHLEVVDGELRYHDHRFPLAPGTADDGADASTVHDRQHYELVGWRRGDSELNYRRFFSITTLAGVRVEEPEVFTAAHAEIRRWFDEGLVDGLRVDHPDGLRDPGAYLEDLAALTGGAYVLVEKILEPGEELLPGWATAGTTGYDVLALLDRVLTDPGGAVPLDDLETHLRGTPLDWEGLVLDRKRDVARGILLAETRRIVRELPALEGHETGSAEVLEDAVAEVLACFPVYRSYLPEGREHLEAALDRARSLRPDLAGTIDALAPVLCDPEAPAAQRFQQTSGMVMAKGVEDCSFYRAARLTSLNEVGGDPGVFSVGVEHFHDAMARRQREWPHAMTTLSTHDTKRGEDVRARISTLAELPAVWAAALERLLELAPLPDRDFGALLWQAVVGCWPAASSEGGVPADLRERLHAYAEKAMREAGDRTTWTDPDASYEDAVHRAVDAAIDDDEVRGIVEDLVRSVATVGWSNALTAKLVAITAPGVCDVYQGSELWEQSLVDPDNRRPVDFDRRAELLAGLTSAPTMPTGPAGRDDEGALKLWVTATALRLRRDRPELFDDYAPLVADGEAAEHLLGFDRGGAITLATRLPVGLEARGGWSGTTLRLPDGRWRDVLAGSGQTDALEGTIEVERLLGVRPVALLVRED